MSTVVFDTDIDKQADYQNTGTSPAPLLIHDNSEVEVRHAIAVEALGHEYNNLPHPKRPRRHAPEAINYQQAIEYLNTCLEEREMSEDESRAIWKALELPPSSEHGFDLPIKK